MHSKVRVLALVLILGFAGRVSAQVADPAPSPELAYEGTLTESNAPVTGTRPFVFSILDSTGNESWTSGQQILTVTGGLYAVVLGATGMPAIPASLTLKANLRLHVIADGVALSPDISLVPSFQAGTAWNVNGPFFGDISGTQQGISVDKLKGTPIDLTSGASAGQVLTFNGTSWIASNASGGAGSQGPAGPQGPIGPAGTTGAIGPQGITGLTGPQGPTGVAGTNGSGFDFRNAFDASASYAVDDVVTFNGSSYVAIVASSGPNNLTPSANASQWSVMAQEGAAGAAGAQGSAGAAGGTGAQGPAGTTGAAGPQGLPGSAGSTGSQGPMGLAGVNGANGTNGTNGADGASPFTLDGSNAVFTTGSVAIGIDPPNTTAALDLTSTTKGLLAPRMTTAQRLAIATPANGLIVYDTQLVSLQVYDAVGSVWNQLADTAAITGTVTSVTATSPINVSNGATTPAIPLGTVPVSNGGTGATTLTGYLLGNGSSAVTASNTIPGSAISGNIAANAANVTGTVAVANGGTGATTLTGYLLGSGTGAVTATPTIAVAHGGTGATTLTQGQVLFGTGTTAISSSSGLFWNSSNSRLGIGTTTPGYPIDIESSVTTSFSGQYGYLNDEGDLECDDVGFGTGNAPFSLYATGRVVSVEFDAISDARIKNVIGPSDTASDLETLKKLKITNYSYIDTAGKGNQPKKGVIAQEVERVYPDAVRTVTDFIPSVYVIADGALYDNTTHKLTLTVSKEHGFAVGDMVRIVPVGAGSLDKPVASVTDSHTFVLADVENPVGEVFVFGKKVNDFRVVDYDQLFSMNIGATQQLAMQNHTLMKENADMKAENEAIRTRLVALEQAIDDLRRRK